MTYLDADKLLSDEAVQTLERDLEEAYEAEKSFQEMAELVLETVRHFAALASHPTPDGQRDNEAGRLAAFEALTTGDFFTFTDGGEGQEEYVWRYVDAVLNAYLAATPDGPASPVLGDEERERLKELACGLETGYFRGSNSPAVTDYALSSADLLRKLAQGEERDG